MSQAKHAATPVIAPITHTLGHWCRVLIAFMSFGFIYPNAFTEGMDLSSIQNKTEGDLYKKK